jgi:hypothetical protein
MHMEIVSPYRLNPSQRLHRLMGLVGYMLLVCSIVAAVVFGYQHFYTWFAVGSWLVLDWLDYRKNRTSILGYFYNHKHRDAFFIFFCFATIMAFLVDYVYGVRLSGMWQRPAYSDIHFLRMYAIMNTAYIFGMYELFRLIRSYLQPYVSSRHHAHFALFRTARMMLGVLGVIAGAAALTAPYVASQQGGAHMEYVMILPFIGMWLMGDSITSLLKGKPIIGELMRGNVLQGLSLGLTVLSAAFVTEFINLYAHEWIYAYMPFQGWNVLGIPVAVFVGWTPLVVGVIAIVNMVKHLDYVRDARAAARADVNN